MQLYSLVFFSNFISTYFMEWMWINYYTLWLKHWKPNLCTHAIGQIYHINTFPNQGMIYCYTSVWIPERNSEHCCDKLWYLGYAFYVKQEEEQQQLKDQISSLSCYLFIFFATQNSLPGKYRFTLSRKGDTASVREEKRESEPPKTPASTVTRKRMFMGLSEQVVCVWCDFLGQ